MATHSSILAWRVPWTEEPGGVHGVAKSQTRLSDFTALHVLNCHMSELLALCPVTTVLSRTDYRIYSP